MTQKFVQKHSYPFFHSCCYSKMKEGSWKIKKMEKFKIFGRMNKSFLPSFSRGSHSEVKQTDSPFSFEIVHQSSKSRARVTKINTKNGTITTPCFVPVATKGTIKSLDSNQAKDCYTQLMFCNTFHLEGKTLFYSLVSSLYLLTLFFGSVSFFTANRKGRRTAQVDELQRSNHHRQVFLTLFCHIFFHFFVLAEDFRYSVSSTVQKWEKS